MLFDQPNVRVPYDQWMKFSRLIQCQQIGESKGYPSVSSITLAGKTLVAVAGLYGRVESAAIECAVAIPASMYDGTPMTYPEHNAAREKDDSRRGNYYGLGVKIRGQLCVLTDSFVIGATAPDPKLAVSRTAITSGSFGMYYSGLIRRGNWQRIGDWDALVDDEGDQIKYAAFWKCGQTIQPLLVDDPLTLASEPALMPQKIASMGDQFSLF